MDLLKFTNEKFNGKLYLSCDVFAVNSGQVLDFAMLNVLQALI